METSKYKLWIASFTAVFLFAGQAWATLLVSDPFTYPDGSLVGATGSIWDAHSSAGINPVTVSSNQIKLVFSNNEDVNIALTNGPYNGANGIANLYASMTVNFTALPSATGGGSSGNYFAHFKTTSDTSGFRCRLFAAQTNTSYRLAIGSTNTPYTSAGISQLQQDLSLNTNYTVVLRLNLNTGNSTLWVNPANESSASVSSTADPGTAASITAFAFRQPGSTPGTVLIDNLKVGTVFGDVAGPNTAPVIGAIGNQNTAAGVTTAPIAFDVSDAETPATNLTVSVASSNSALVPNGNIAVSGTGGTRSLVATPLPGQQGSTTITVSVTDTDHNTVSTHFVLTVGVPGISAIANQNVPQGSALAPISFTVTDSENDSLQVTAISSYPTLLPNTTNNIRLGGSGINRTLTLTPASGQSGLSTVTVFVSDGFNTNSTSFVLAVNPQYGLLFSDSFSYLDGPLFGATNSVWDHHSPTGTNNQGELLVNGGAAKLNEALNEDLNAALTNGPFAASNAVMFYGSFNLRAASLPVKTGDYFIHFKDGGSTFRGRVFVQTTNAATGFYRLSVANAASLPVAEIAQDLALNTNYFVVFRYDSAAMLTTLWLNPASESDAHVTAADVTSTSSISAIALRENSGIGSLQIDDLKVGTSFADVTGTTVVVRPTMQWTRLNPAVGQMSWPISTTAYTVQSSVNLTNWQTAGSASVLNGQNVLLITNDQSRLFFRLKQ